MIGDGNGKLTHLEFILTMELGEPDASGRRRPVPVEGSEEILPADNVIAAIGQFPELTFLQKDDTGKEIELTRWNSLAADDDTMATNVPGIFAAGDGVLGAATVVQAIGTGRKAARTMHLYLSGEDAAAQDNWVTDPKTQVRSRTQIPGAPEPGPRAKMPELHVPQRAGSFVEVELGLEEEAARAEAQRCLQCGLICYRHQPGAQDLTEPGCQGCSSVEG